MFELPLLVLVLGLLHFALGGLWYSPLGFSQVWMRGLGVTQVDIAEARIDVRAGLAASAAASVTQAAVLVWVLWQIGDPGVVAGAVTGAAIAIGFSFLPMLKDRVWADRAWSVILVDASYEIVAASLVGGLVGWWL
jgi:Protein of unknown function (DUF1761)